MEEEMQSTYMKLCFNIHVKYLAHPKEIFLFKWEIMMQTNIIQLLLSNCNDDTVMLTKIQVLQDVK